MRPPQPSLVPEPDPGDVRRVLAATGLLRAFNAAGVLAAADVHVARCLARLGSESDEAVVLGAALAVRAPRLGHVCTDLAGVATSVTVDADHPVDLEVLAWPDAGDWIHRLSASRLVSLGVDGAADRPLRLAGTRLYLDRYWREERLVAAQLGARAESPVAGVDLPCLRAGLGRLFPGEVTDPQRLAAATAVLRRLSVVAGGPGTGKTTTVARILALLQDQADAGGRRPPLVALAAPTAKAAARLEEAVHHEAARLELSESVRQRLLETAGSTLHRLLGWLPGSSTRFRHDGRRHLPHEVVVVDETSMVSLSLMASLLAAVRPEARLILVGDPEQLASVEAGAVLGDIVGPAGERALMRGPARQALAAAVGQPVAADPAPPGCAIGDGIVVLRRVHRFGGSIARLAAAIQAGEPETTLEVLASGAADVTWLPVAAAAGLADGALSPVREAVLASGRPLLEAARRGDGRGALQALGSFRLLCAHRRGPAGVAIWQARVEAWLSAEVDGLAAVGEWYVGRPLLVAENDYALGLFNGDTGVVVATPEGRLRAVFERRGELVAFPPIKLEAVETVHAMTVHKAQGSQFDTVALILPPADSPILTRELLYTAVTRARAQVIVAGEADAIRAAVRRPIARASGLRDWLWGGE